MGMSEGLPINFALAHFILSEGPCRFTSSEPTTSPFSDKTELHYYMYLFRSFSQARVGGWWWTSKWSCLIVASGALQQDGSDVAGRLHGLCAGTQASRCSQLVVVQLIVGGRQQLRQCPVSVTYCCWCCGSLTQSLDGRRRGWPVERGGRTGRVTTVEWRRQGAARGRHVHWQSLTVWLLRQVMKWRQQWWWWFTDWPRVTAAAGHIYSTHQQTVHHVQLELHQHNQQRQLGLYRRQTVSHDKQRLAIVKPARRKCLYVVYSKMTFSHRISTYKYW